MYKKPKSSDIREGSKKIQQQKTSGTNNITIVQCTERKYKWLLWYKKRVKELEGKRKKKERRHE